MNRNQTIWIAGDTTPCSHALAQELEASGYQPWTEGPLDYFIYSIHPPLRKQQEYGELAKSYEETAVGLLREVEKALPYLEQGEQKRLCFLTSVQSSVNLNRGDCGFEAMVSAACNMAIATLFNRLNPQGFTFRVMALEEFSPEEAGYAKDYFLRNRSLEEESARHSDEKRLVMRDRYETELPW